MSLFLSHVSLQPSLSIALFCFSFSLTPLLTVYFCFISFSPSLFLSVSHSYLSPSLFAYLYCFSFSDLSSFLSQFFFLTLSLSLDFSISISKTVYPLMCIHMHKERNIISPYRLRGNIELKEHIICQVYNHH